MKSKIQITTIGLAVLAVCALLVPATGGFGQSAIQFRASVYTVAESAAAATLIVQRTNDTETEVTVDYATTNATASAGLDYTTTNGTLTFGAGETNQTISVPILNDGLVEGLFETFTVTLSNPAGGAVLGTPATASVRITDNDKGLQFEFGGYTVAEGEGRVLLGVARGDDGNFPASVDYFTTDGTAKNGLDYTGVTNTLFFALGDQVQTLTVPIINDGLKETSETFRVTLRNPTNQVLGTRKIATVTVSDNDLGVQLDLAQAQSQYWVQESEGTLTVKVLRGNDMEPGPFTVDFATSDLTATAGADYAGTNTTLAFAQDEMAKIITVPILYDVQPEADEQFKVTLSHPTNAVLGPYATATVTILDTTGMAPHRFEGIGVLPDRHVQLSLGGGVSDRFRNYFDLYPIEVSSNLAGWTPLATLVRTNANTNALLFADTNAAPFNQRYYGTRSDHFLTPFPKPTGPYPVGTFSRILTDPSRRNRYNLSTNSSFMSTFWYPAQPPGAGRVPGSYTDEAVARDPDFYFYWGFSSRWPGVIPLLVAHSIPNIPLASGTNRFPVILHSHGYTCDRRLNSKNAEELASHGYIVAAVDHEDCHATVYPDSRGVRYIPPGSYSDQAAGVPSRTNDIQCLLRELNQVNEADPVLGGRLDLERIGVMGFSFGGGTAAETCRADGRVKCAALLDAYIDFTYYPALSSQGLQKPFLAMNRTIIDHNPPVGDLSPASEHLYTLAARDAVWLKISNTGHFAFSDCAWAVEMIPGSRPGALALDACLVWFFDTYLKGETPPFPTNPELINVQRK